MDLSKSLNTALYGAKSSAIRVFSALAAATPGCIALTLGEPDFDTPAPIVEKVEEAFQNHETHYIANNGSMELREAISRYEREKNGLNYGSDEIIITAGATEALFTALFGILNPGDEVIIPSPYFVLYEEIIRLCRGVTIPLDTSENDFQIDSAALQAKITPRTKAILINSPNNPTGCMLNRKSLEIIRDAVKDSNIFVITDDVYRQLVYEGEYHSFAEFQEVRDNILVVQSFSKPYAMTGWRMGYLMADKKVMERLAFVHQYAVTSTPAPFQRACIAALDYDPAPMREVFRRRREYVVDRLQKMGLELTVPEGAFYVFPSIKKLGLDSSTFCTRMVKEAGVAVTPGLCFGAEGYIRITYSYSDDTLKEGLDRLERFLSTL